MEYQRIRNLLGNIPDEVPKLITKKWIQISDQSGEAYNTNKEIRFKKSMLRSDLCDYNNAYIVVKGIVTVSADGKDRDAMNRQVVLKNNAPFISCISKINGVLAENAEDLDVVIPMYNLLEYSKNYSKTSASDETNDSNDPKQKCNQIKVF